MPFEHPKAFSFLENLANQWSIDEVVCLGDEMDQHCLSMKFVGDPDGYSPGHEYELALESLERLYKIFPKVKVCFSNHGLRVYKKAYAVGIPKAYLRAAHEFSKAPKGWEWKQSWEIDKCLYIHGDAFSGSTWMRMHNTYRQSTICGHQHSRAGVVYSNTSHSNVFSANFGCLINPDAYAFAYGKIYPEKPCLGSGIVIDGKEAYFIPMPIQSGSLNKIAAGKLRP